MECRTKRWNYDILSLLCLLFVFLFPHPSDVSPTIEGLYKTNYYGREIWFQFFENVIFYNKNQEKERDDVLYSSYMIIVLS